MTGRPDAGAVGTLWLAIAALTAYEIAPATLFPVIRTQLGVSATAASWIVSLLLLSMAVWSIPAGVLLDRLDERRVLGVAMGGVALAAAWGWWAGVEGDYPSLLASRVLGGVAIVTVWTAAVDLAGAAVRERHRATAIGVITTAVPAGFALGHLGSPAIAERFGWAATFPAFVAVGVAGWVGFAVAARFVEFRAVDADPPTVAEFRRVLTDRAVLSVGVLGFAAFSLNLFFNSWLPSYLVEEFAVGLGVGGLTTAVFPAVGIVSRASSGPASTRLFGGRRRPVVLAGFLVTAPMVVVVGVVDAGPVLVGVLAVAGFAVQFSLAILFTYVRELVDPTVAGTALAVLNTVGFLGAFSAPLVAGALIDATGEFLPAFGYAGLLALVGVAVAVVAPEVRQ